MRAVSVLLFAAVVGALAAQTTPPAPRPTVPAAQVPRAEAPRVQPARPETPAVPAPQSPAFPGQMPQPDASAGQVFEGTWSASGQRQTLTTEAGHPAVTVQLSGAVSLKAGAGLSRGFRGEVIGFDDGAGLIAGRVVWTDERGDRIYSVLRGDGLTSAGRPMGGTITGGTGRYIGVTGEYEFRWQYVIAAEGSISGRAADLRGRVRPGGSGR